MVDEISTRIRQLREKIGYREIMPFLHNGVQTFRPMAFEPKEEGDYIVIRCGLSGIYTDVDAWIDGKWYSGNMRDGSEIIAYGKI